MHNDANRLGLPADLKLLQRRQLLRLTAGAGVATLLACRSDTPGSDGTTPSSTSTSTTSTSTSTSSSTAASTDINPTGDRSCPSIPAETAGPYPGDGSNGANALALAGILRSDIRSSVADANGTAQGITLTITLTIVDSSCTPLANHAVYIWHCDRAADYSMYTGSATAENYLRGVQVTDSDGKVSFTSIFPGCYPGRWPHVHFEVYPSLAATDDADNKLRTSQFAFPKAACELVFATAGYEDSLPNLAKLTLASDSVFSDGFDQQLAELSGSVETSYTATLTIAV